MQLRVRREVEAASSEESSIGGSSSVGSGSGSGSGFGLTGFGVGPTGAGGIGRPEVPLVPPVAPAIGSSSNVSTGAIFPPHAAMHNPVIAAPTTPLARASITRLSQRVPGSKPARSPFYQRDARGLISRVRAQS